MKRLISGIIHSVLYSVRINHSDWFTQFDNCNTVLKKINKFEKLNPTQPISNTKILDPTQSNPTQPMSMSATSADSDRNTQFLPDMMELIVALYWHKHLVLDLCLLTTKRCPLPCYPSLPHTSINCSSFHHNPNTKACDSTHTVTRLLAPYTSPAQSNAKRSLTYLLTL